MRFPFLICTCNTFLLDQSLYPHPLASKALASAAVTRGKSCPKGTNCSFSLSLFEVVLRVSMHNMFGISSFGPRCSILNRRVNRSGDSRNSDNTGTLQPTKDHLRIGHFFPVFLRQSVCDLFADDISRTIGRGGDRLRQQHFCRTTRTVSKRTRGRIFQPSAIVEKILENRGLTRSSP